MSATFQQVEFSQERKKMICWTDKISELKEGSVCELKEVPGYWTVEKIHPVKMERVNINRTWKCGGLA